MRDVADGIATIRHAAIKNQSVALHELRKLNRVIVQNSERLCAKESPGAPDSASPELVSIMKTSEIMSKQFDIIEILADEGLARLPTRNQIEVYKIFDKCVRIYRQVAGSRRLVLKGDGSNAERILACDKTFPILSTVLIENAIRYSPDGSDIFVTISHSPGKCSVSISNRTPRNQALNDSVFERGVRASSVKDGSGNGLYVAQLVAKQHGSRLRLRTEHNFDSTTCIFSMEFATISDARHGSFSRR